MTCLKEPSLLQSNIEGASAKAFLLSPEGAAIYIATLTFLLK